MFLKAIITVSYTIVLAKLLELYCILQKKKKKTFTKTF